MFEPFSLPFLFYDASLPYKVEDVAKERPYLKTNQVTDGALSDSGQPEAALTKTSVAAARQSLDPLAHIISNRPQKAQAVFGALKTALENIENGKPIVFGGRSLSAKNFVTTMQALGFNRKPGADSAYLVIGGDAAVRASDHSANAELFIQDGTDNNLSVVIRRPHSAAKRFNAGDSANVVEAVYTRADLRDIIANGEAEYYKKTKAKRDLLRRGTISPAEQMAVDATTQPGFGNKAKGWGRFLTSKEPWMWLREKMQDSQISLRDEEGKRGVKANDSAYHAFDAAYGMIANDLKNFNEKTLDPFNRELAAKGFDEAKRKRLDMLTWALHALEANRMIAERSDVLNKARKDENAALLSVFPVQPLVFRYFILSFTYDFEELTATTTYDFEEFPLTSSENFDIIFTKTKDFKTLCT